MELGFSFREPDYAHAPGSPKLKIHIYAHPTEEHFDPKNVSLNLVTEDGILDEHTIVHPWYFRQEFRAGPGQVVMTDRKGKEERAFTFGGFFYVESMEEKTICNLISTAPILYLDGLVDMPTILANEV